MAKTKYQVQVTTKIGDEVSTLEKRSFETPKDAFYYMRRLAIRQIAVLMRENSSVESCYTSDSRYPDAWGFANNGILLTAKSGNDFVKYYQWEIIEI